VGTTAPSTWTRADSTGRYDLEFAASAALGTRAGLSLSGVAIAPPSSSRPTLVPRAASLLPLGLLPFGTLWLTWVTPVVKDIGGTERARRKAARHLRGLALRAGVSELAAAR
jgi:hypothetical protein